MKFTAKALHVRYSPYKLRPVADVIRGKKVTEALSWLSTYKAQRSVPVFKLLTSAVANAKSRDNVGPESLVVQEIRVDQGPMYRYAKPSAQGRAMPQRRRTCHISIELGVKVLVKNLKTKRTN